MSLVMAKFWFSSSWYVYFFSPWIRRLEFIIYSARSLANSLASRLSSQSLFLGYDSLLIRLPHTSLSLFRASGPQ